jgi:hypothetical protein
LRSLLPRSQPEKKLSVGNDGGVQSALYRDGAKD